MKFHSTFRSTFLIQDENILNKNLKRGKHTEFLIQHEISAFNITAMVARKKILRHKKGHREYVKC